MSKSNLDLRKLFHDLYTFYMNNQPSAAFASDYYLRMKSAYLNLFIMGGYFDLRPEDNKALYKFSGIPLHLENPEITKSWHELFNGDKTNEDVLKFFSMANGIDCESFPQVDSPQLDPEWYQEWLATPIENFQFFGLSASHALYLSTGGPCW